MARLGNKLSRAGSSKHTTPTKSKPKSFHLQYGTPNALGAALHFESGTKLKNAATKVVQDWEPWCRRHNSAGLDELYAAVQFINTWYDSLPEDGTAMDATYMFDEHTGTALRLRMWRTP